MTRQVETKAGKWPNADMLPTPNTINRTGAKMLRGKCPGRKYRTSLGLEQVAEISEGIMPKEMDSLDDAPVFKHLWPESNSDMYMTPNCMDGMPGKSQKALDHEYTHRKGRKSPNNLRDQIAVDEGERTWPNADMLPSPRSSRGGYTRDKGDPSKERLTLEGMVKLIPTPRANSGTGKCKHGDGAPDLQTYVQLPTPRASEYKGVGPIGSSSHKHHLKKKYLGAIVQEGEGRTGQLNPDWTEVLMGWPPGWTSIEPLPPEVWAMWQRQFNNWWPSHSPTAWHCLELIYPRLTAIKEHRTNRLKAIGNGQVPQSKVMAIKSNIGEFNNPNGNL